MSTGSLLDNRLILVTGKGGVGRSTVAAAIASATAKRGRRTLLFQANANDRFGAFFGRQPVGPQITPLAPNLHAINTSPADALEEYGLMVLRFKRVYKMIFENRVSRYFLRAIPGLDDYSILGKAWYHTTETTRGRPTWDTLVFDMPASGHCLSMLRIPKVILETVPEGPLTRDAGKILQLLRDPARTTVIAVTLAEEMPTNEASELRASLDRELGISVQHLIINQVYPSRFDEGSIVTQILDAIPSTDEHHGNVPDAHAAGASDLTALVAHSRLARSRRLLNEHYLAELARIMPIPTTQLPYIFSPTMGGQEIQTLSSMLEERLS